MVGRTGRIHDKYGDIKSAHHAMVVTEFVQTVDHMMEMIMSFCTHLAQAGILDGSRLPNRDWQPALMNWCKAMFLTAVQRYIEFLFVTHILEFPKGCEFYNGPHSKDCLVSVWEKIGCLQSGRGNPKNLARRLIADYTSLNLRYTLCTS